MFSHPIHIVADLIGGIPRPVKLSEITCMGISEFAGKKVIKIDESYTSKTCCSCGNQHDMPLHQREMICDCGNNIDRDRNSAINIMLRYLSQNANWTGYRDFLDNLQTGLQLVVICKNLHA
jgi:hypothetical protein